MALGERLVFAGNHSHPYLAFDFGGYAILLPKDDSGSGCRRDAAENDDADATDVRVHVLLRVVRTCTILVDRERSRHLSAAHHQPIHASVCARSGIGAGSGNARCAQSPREEGQQKITR